MKKIIAIILFLTVCAFNIVNTMDGICKEIKNTSISKQIVP